VDAGATPEIRAGVQVSSTRYNYSDNIYDFNVYGTVSATGAAFTGYTDLNVLSGGTLNLSGTTVSGSSADVEDSSVEFQAGAMGTLRYTKFNVPLTLSAATAVSVRESDFSAGSVIATGGSNLTINLTHNWWGSTDRAVIEGKMTHKPDDGSRPLVECLPCLVEPPSEHLLYVIDAWPSQPISWRTNFLDITFNRPIDLATLTSEDIYLADVDLLVGDLQVDATQLWAGDPVHLSWRVSNSTGVPLLGDWSDAVYLSADETWDIGDVRAGRPKLESGGLVQLRLKPHEFLGFI
jgi:hypothetical protein